jgi:hypothetical protein
VYVGRDYSPQERIESEVLGLDFINDLDAGETLISTAWTIAPISGVDPDPTDHLEGPSKVVTPIGGFNFTCTIQRVGGLLPGVTYRIGAVAITTLGNTRKLWSHIRGIDDDI